MSSPSNEAASRLSTSSDEVPIPQQQRRQRACSELFVLALGYVRDWIRELFSPTPNELPVVSILLMKQSQAAASPQYLQKLPIRTIHLTNPVVRTAFSCKLYKASFAMAESTSPDAENWLPAPRLSRLVYRGSRDNSQSDKDWRPRPTAQAKVVERHFTTLNSVEDDRCWLTRQGPAERAHVVPHAERRPRTVATDLASTAHPEGPPRRSSRLTVDLVGVLCECKGRCPRLLDL